MLAHLFPPLSALILCAAILVIGVDLWNDHERVRADNEKSLHTIAHAMAQQTSRTLQAIDLTLTGVTDTLRDTQIDWHNPHDSKTNQILAEKRQRAAFARSLFLVDARGQMV